MAAKLSQERLGVLAGIDEMSASARMNQYERDKHTPDVSMVDRIARVLNLPTSYFYAQRDDEAEFLKRLHVVPDQDRGHLLELMEKMAQKPGNAGGK